MKYSLYLATKSRDAQAWANSLKRKLRGPEEVINYLRELNSKEFENIRSFPLSKIDFIKVDLGAYGATEIIQQSPLFRGSLSLMYLSNIQDHIYKHKGLHIEAYKHFISTIGQENTIIIGGSMGEIDVVPRNAFLANNIRIDHCPNY